MKNKSEHLEPLSPENWPPELADIHRDLVNPLNIHNILAHHADLTLAWMPFRNHVVSNSSLEPRHRELLILRTAANCDADYEWQHHVQRGLEAGLSDAEIQWVKDGPMAKQWSPRERLLLQAADECHRDCKIGEETYRELRSRFNVHEQLDIIATVGMYITLALMIKTFGVALEESN